MRNECLFVCSNSDQKKKITVFNISLVSKDACDLNDWWWQRLTFAAGCCCCLSHFFASFSKCPKGRRCNKKDGGKDVSFYFLFSRKKEYSLIKYDGWLDGWLAWWKKPQKNLNIFSSSFLGMSEENEEKYFKFQTGIFTLVVQLGKKECWWWWWWWGKWMNIEGFLWQMKKAEKKTFFKQQNGKIPFRIQKAKWWNEYRTFRKWKWKLLDETQTKTKPNQMKQTDQIEYIWYAGSEKKFTFPFSLCCQIASWTRLWWSGLVS